MEAQSCKNDIQDFLGQGEKRKRKKGVSYMYFQCIKLDPKVSKDPDA